MSLQGILTITTQKPESWNMTVGEERKLAYLLLGPFSNFLESTPFMKALVSSKPALYQPSSPLQRTPIFQLFGVYSSYHPFGTQEDCCGVVRLLMSPGDGSSSILFGVYRFGVSAGEILIKSINLSS